MSAPASLKAWARAKASSRPWVARASVRARIRMSAPSSRASTAGLHARDRLGARDHLLAAGVAAALGPDLVLDHDRGEASLRVAAHAAFRVHRVAVAGVGVADHRDRHRGADVAPLIEHLTVGNEPGVGQAEARRRDRVAAHEGEREAGRLDEPRRKRVEAARHDQRAPAPISCMRGDEGAQTRGGTELFGHFRRLLRATTQPTLKRPDKPAWRPARHLARTSQIR